MYTVTLNTTAKKSLKSIPKQHQKRIVDILKLLARDPRPRKHRKLKGSPKDLPLYRVRIGNYRVLYSVNDGELRVVVIDIGDRKEVYRRL